MIVVVLVESMWERNYWTQDNTRDYIEDQVDPREDDKSPRSSKELCWSVKEAIRVWGREPHFLEGHPKFKVEGNF